MPPPHRRAEQAADGTDHAAGDDAASVSVSVQSGDESDGPGPELPRRYQTETRFDAGQDVVFDTMIGAARADAGMADGLQAGGAPVSSRSGRERDVLDEDDDVFDADGGAPHTPRADASPRTIKAGKSVLPLAGTVGNVQRVSARHIPEHYGAFYVLLALMGLYPARWMSRGVYWAWCSLVIATITLRNIGSAASQSSEGVVYGVCVASTALVSMGATLTLTMRRRLLLRAMRVHYVFEQAFYNRRLNAAEKERQRRVVSALFRGNARRATIYCSIVFAVAFLVFNVPRFIYFFDPQDARSGEERTTGEYNPTFVDEYLLVPAFGHVGTQVYLIITDLWFFGVPVATVGAYSLVYQTVSHQRNLIAGHQVMGTADGVPVDEAGHDDDDAGAAEVSESRGRGPSVSARPSSASLSLGPDTARGRPAASSSGGRGDPSWRSRMSFAYRLTFSLHERATAALKPWYVMLCVSNGIGMLIFGYMLLATEGSSPRRALLVTPLMIVAALAFVAEYVHKLHRQSLRASEFLRGEFGQRRRGSLTMMTDVGRTTVRGAAALGGPAEEARRRVLDDVMDGRRGFDHGNGSDDDESDDDNDDMARNVTWKTASRQATGSGLAPPVASFRFTLSDLESMTTMRRSELPAVGLAGPPRGLETAVPAAVRDRKYSTVDRGSYVSSGVPASAVASVLAVLVQNATILSLVAVGLTALRFSLQFPPCVELSATGNVIDENLDACSDTALLVKNVESSFFAQPVVWGLALWVAIITFRVRPFMERFFDILIVQMLVTVAASVGIYAIYVEYGHDSRAAIFSSAVLLALVAYMASSVYSALGTRRVFYLLLYVVVCFVAFLAVKYVSVRFVSAEDDDERFAYVVVAVPLMRTVVMGVVLALVKKMLPLAAHPTTPMTRQYALLALPLAVFGTVGRLFIFSLEGAGGILSSIVLVSVQEVFVRLTVMSRTGAAVFALSRGSLTRAVEAMNRVRDSDLLPDRIYTGMLVEHYCLTAALGITVLGRLLYDIELKMGTLLAVWTLQLVAELAADFASIMFEEGMMDIFEVRYWQRMAESPANYLLPCSFMLWAVQCFMGLEFSAVVRLS